jgi:hypothetical protein
MQGGGVPGYQVYPSFSGINVGENWRFRGTLIRARIGLRLPFFEKNHVLIVKTHALSVSILSDFCHFHAIKKTMSLTMPKWALWGRRYERKP